MSELHLYECPDCGQFEPPEGYNDDPQTRCCAECGTHAGKIQYLGNYGSKVYVISDTLPGGIDGMQSMADGKHYTSKAAYYRSLKERGLEIDDRKDIKTTTRPSTFDERKFNQAFKRTLEQLNA